MSKACKTCKGRGRWQEQEPVSVVRPTDEYGERDNSLVYVWHECNDCKGTGVEQDPEDGEDWDIDGSSYADD